MTDTEICKALKVMGLEPVSYRVGVGLSAEDWEKLLNALANASVGFRRIDEAFKAAAALREPTDVAPVEGSAL